MTRTRHVVVVAVAVLIAGCSSDDVATCTGLPGICVEYDRSDDPAQTNCAVGNGDFNEGEVCPTADRIGGCRSVFSSDQGETEATWWFYPGAERDTEAEIRSYCDLIQGEYLTP